jgi:dUTPase
MELKIKLLRETSQLPKKANIEDAAFDCYVNSIEYLADNKVKVGLGFAVEVPKGYMLNLVSRSSITKSEWFLANSIGIIDSGYVEEVFAVFRTDAITIIADEDDDFPYKIGDRCCQIYLQKIIPTELITVNHIKGSRSGFGSTN